MSDKHLDAPCESCDGGTSTASRRSFLQLAGCAALSAVALGLSASDASAFAVTIDKTGQVIVVRYQAHRYAFNLACPHQNHKLRWLPKENRFQCPKHESK